MILGNISEINKKSVFPKILLKYLNYIKTTDFSKFADGKYPLGRDVVMNLFSYQTKKLKEKKAEVHKKYIDIQYVISGTELIGLGFNNPQNELLEEYNEEKDCTFYKKIENEHFLVINRGMFVIFFPTDIHRPGCIFNEKSDIRKMVIKILVNKYEDEKQKKTI
ncbi:YhcH/YjgK/YiaL family protein [Patescibacteria group bacterium]|nr:YhcH/YjgK/YiaL family protein [Patescibacteria group bacterium]